MQMLKVTSVINLEHLDRQIETAVSLQREVRMVRCEKVKYEKKNYEEENGERDESRIETD